MVIRLDPDLEAAITEAAIRRGIEPKTLAIATLRSRFPGSIVPRDDWERRLLSIATNRGVSFPPSALTSEEIYD